MAQNPPLTVAVVGAGIIGLCAALEIQRAGHQVLLVEPNEPGGRQAASYGNASWLNPGAIAPISLPGLWRKVPGFLLDRAGPFTVRWRDLASHAGWLARFVAAGKSWGLIERCAKQRYALCRDTVTAHQRYAEEAGVGHLIQQRGLIYVYPDRSGFAAEHRIWAIRRELGVRFTEIGETELRGLLPELSPAYRFGARLDEAGQIADPGAYCAALARLLVARGGQLIAAKATGFAIENGRLRSVVTSNGPLNCERAVLAAGIGSAALARQAGDRVPLISERGYHVVIPEPGLTLSAGLMPSDGQMGVVSTPQGLRLAGQVEFAAPDAPPDWRRAAILLSYARKMFPAHASRFDAAAHDRWMGNRPSTPDGLPCVGPASGCADIVHAFGHAHTGLTQAPATARLVAAMIDGGAPLFDPAPYSARRFA
ncbi:FAD-binding oxidoreductase [Bosea sp. (in: a-proteobacteria)]|uniref:NAD(P)/FAD-dependent oxidoreductase n=1 Tax=Bosea sp. (in: a-proteobacteria) TaxID=1871050 RepID=UPI001207E5B7|nr:FAD-binding oxidoreductase [Bosea sp. (in: a-proteobacteria)]TAJ33270.1 MAG: FAD-binding oxidoreductase [Bosea sp. (in: a-proteobacteria)]